MAKTFEIKLPCPNEVHLEKYYELAKSEIEVNFENNEVTMTAPDRLGYRLQHIEARYKSGRLFL